MKRIAVGLASCFSLVASASMPSGPWFKGTVEQAFELSAKDKKPLFLYWGAAWCPPCNEIKSEVFSKPRFVELLGTVVPVYLDGDTDNAQIWGDKLKVSGYPTLVVLSAGGSKEIARIKESVNVEEFEQAFESSISADRPFEETLQNALAGKADAQDWKILSLFSWQDTHASLNLTPEKLIVSRYKLVESIPAKFNVEKARLIASLLESAASFDASNASDETKIVLRDTKDNRQKYIDFIFANPKRIEAVRSTVVYLSKDLAEYLLPATEKERIKFVSQWVSATKKIRKLKNISVDTRLWSFAPELAFFEVQNKDKPVPAELRKTIQLAVGEANFNAKSKFSRHAVISGAAILLAKVGDKEGARKILQDELQKTDTPWYYESTFAEIEKKDGNLKEALSWSDKAAASAKGNATKLQWSAANLMFAIKNAEELKLPKETLKTKASAYYEMATMLPDGFVGRNASRQKKLVEMSESYFSKEERASFAKTYSSRCANLPEDSSKNCTQHFKDLGKNEIK